MNQAPSYPSNGKPFKSIWANNIALWSVGAMGFSINFGVAMVSVSSLLIVLAALFIFVSRQHKSADLETDRTHSKETTQRLSQRPKLTVYLIPIAILWMAVTGLWTESSLQDSATQLMRYSRILVIPLIFFLIRTPEQSIKVLKVWIFGQLFVIASSYLLWIGIPIPWTSTDSLYAMQYLTPYTSTLEQPIMNTIMFIVVWHLRDEFVAIWGKLTVNLILVATVFEVFFIMEGRTGFLCMVLTLTLIFWRGVGSKLRILAVFLPLILLALVYTTSSRFERRVGEVVSDVQNYNQGKMTSQGNRIDFTKNSIIAIQEKPILGYGLGSWPLAYRHARGSVPTEFKDGVIKELKADNPHQQFMLWFVEGGVIAFGLLLGIYYSIYKDSNSLSKPAKHALQLVLACIVFASFLNCPFHGAGMSEFLCFVIAVLLNLVNSDGKSLAST